MPLPLPWLIGAALALLIAVLLWDSHNERQRSNELLIRLAESERELLRYSALIPRADNPPWQEALHADRLKRDQLEDSDEYKQELFASHNRFPHGHNRSKWRAHLRATTPAAYEDAEHGLDTTPAWCSDQSDLSGIVVSEEELHPPDGGPLSLATRRRAHHALTECGYVYLDNFFSRETVERLRQAYVALRDSDEGKDMLYPCQGTGRVEHMLPFRQPFNNSEIYADERLITLLQDYLHEHFKLELMTVITSPPGAKDQRWHQGWRYLFHPDEQVPPYAVVVALPLADVTNEMGPTEICPGKKLRFYHGWRCHEHSIMLGSTAGTNPL